MDEKIKELEKLIPNFEEVLDKIILVAKESPKKIEFAIKMIKAL